MSTATQVRLPRADGTLATFSPGPAAAFTMPRQPIRSRVALAAAHVVADPLAENIPGRSARLDWEATLAYRRHLWSWGLGVAEAMDIAQRGMGLDWPVAWLEPTLPLSRLIFDEPTYNWRVLALAGIE